MADVNDLKINGSLRLTQDPHFMPPLQFKYGGTGTQDEDLPPYTLLKVGGSGNYERCWRSIPYYDTYGYHGIKAVSALTTDSVDGATDMKYYGANYALHVTATGAVATSSMYMAGYKTVESSHSLITALNSDSITVGNATTWNGWSIKYDGGYSTSNNIFSIV